MSNHELKDNMLLGVILAEAMDERCFKLTSEKIKEHKTLALDWIWSHTERIQKEFDEESAQSTFSGREFEYERVEKVLIKAFLIESLYEDGIVKEDYRERRHPLYKRGWKK